MPTLLITGAGRGLGLELARQYREDGWKVIGTVRSDKGAAALKKLGASVVTLDVEDFDATRKLRIEGPIDVLVCNAGIIGKRGAALGSFDYAEWEKVLRVNLLGVAAVIEALVENVAASEKKLIVVMSSRLGSITESSGHTLPYGTSKAALNLLAKGLSSNLAPRGITVLAVSPGWVRTDMGGEGAPLSPQSSVSGLRKVLADATASDSGRFFAHDGSPIAW
jgi:NAD(P)-dependent dehydrogenase (short-subunit alcohol dehydrogenase family)